MTSFWLARNNLQLGNPLYPVYMSVFKIFGWHEPPDVDLLTSGFSQIEWVRSSTDWIFYPWREWDYQGPNFSASSGLGPFFAATIPAACAFTAIRLFKTRERKSVNAAFLLAGGLFVMVMWAAMHNHQPRYALGAFIFLVPLVASMITCATGRSRGVLEGITVGCIMTMMFVMLSNQVVEFGTRFIYADMSSRHAFCAVEIRPVEKAWRDPCRHGRSSALC